MTPAEKFHHDYEGKLVRDMPALPPTMPEYKDLFEACRAVALAFKVFGDDVSRENKMALYDAAMHCQDLLGL